VRIEVPKRRLGRSTANAHSRDQPCRIARDQRREQPRCCETHPSAVVARKKRKPWQAFIVHQQQIVDLLQRTRRRLISLARRRFKRRINTRPSDPAAESPMAPNIGAPARV
jgi:hypothetical protein